MLDMIVTKGRMDNADTPNRIRELRKSAGLSQEELGGRMRSELTSSTVAKLEKGRLRLSLEYAQEIADVLGVSFLEVLGMDEVGVRVVPLIGEIAAGNWRDAVQLTEETQVIPADLRGKDLFALRPRGDSMDRVVQCGGFIVVDPGQTELVDGKYYAVMNDEGETTFKQFSQNPLELRPCSTNPAYQPIPVGSQAFTVIGRVVYAGQEM
jgi:repressor LexA